MITVVAYSLIEEAPHDLKFFWAIRGWSELFLMSIVFVSTILYSLPLGIACGIGFSLLRVIKHATRPRIQILGRVHGTVDKFENCEANPGILELIEGCLIVKIPEPLTFANTGDLRNRLRRLEDYTNGTTLAARSSLSATIRRVQRAATAAAAAAKEEEEDKNVIFDVHGVTSLDGAGAQVLAEIVQAYRAKGVGVFFCRVRKASNVWRLFETSRIVEMCGGAGHFVASVQEALALTERGGGRGSAAGGNGVAVLGAETGEGRYFDEPGEILEGVP